MTEECQPYDITEIKPKSSLQFRPNRVFSSVFAYKIIYCIIM